jgi:glutathione peroxidase
MNRLWMALGMFVGMIMSQGAALAGCEGIYNHQFKTLQGERVNLCDYQKRPVLLVNTASKCGFTPQFEKLESMYQRYKDQGLVILGFPSNDFRQELSSNKEIGEFCRMTYSVDFPMMAQSSVVGPGANPLYKQLAAITKEPPMWNFYKYLILPGGKDIYVYSSAIDPESTALMSRLSPYLK